jgi:hypothetical protein
MPKRKVKEEKPRKKLSKKQILLPPVIVGAATLAGILIMYFVPHPPVLDVCLKENADTFNVYPRIQLIVDGDTKLMPDDIGKHWKDGQECLRVISTDDVGDTLHIQYIRPIRLTIADFMKIYAYDNRTISVMENSTGIPKKEILTLKDYNVEYSYFSEKGEFTRVTKPSDIPPFTNDLVVRIQLRSK